MTTRQIVEQILEVFPQYTETLVKLDVNRVGIGQVVWLAIGAYKGGGPLEGLQGAAEGAGQVVRGIWFAVFAAGVAIRSWVRSGGR